MARREHTPLSVTLARKFVADHPRHSQVHHTRDHDSYVSVSEWCAEANVIILDLANQLEVAERALRAPASNQESSQEGS